jgi:hypothetical protein
MNLPAQTPAVSRQLPHWSRYADSRPERGIVACKLTNPVATGQGGTCDHTQGFITCATGCCDAKKSFCWNGQCEDRARVLGKCASFCFRLPATAKDPLYEFCAGNPMPCL